MFLRNNKATKCTTSVRMQDSEVAQRMPSTCMDAVILLGLGSPLTCAACMPLGDNLGSCSRCGGCMCALFCLVGNSSGFGCEVLE
jgi:hypothetical protein